ncbi:LPS biosynthesis-modulating metalloenzyme YejM [Candidatus Williamhamiltonella defendens]|uniref:LPS biosynthesis-modulating metalloenzyme YejM n=1 Tax=Candidatus Williamhamiltonella defendens TaxID=138072 RepID=UPI00130EE2D7|nr:LPS biosynthesis-modulating metalloenzyme YejM [Candidatus Hamiltonella defensa]
MRMKRQHYREKLSQMISWGHWFVLFNIFLTLIFGSRYLFVSDCPTSFLGRVYALVGWLGHFSFIIFVVYLLILFPLTFIIFSQRLLRFFSVILATSWLALLLIDGEIFTRFHLHMTPMIWAFLINPEQTQMSRDWLCLFIAIPIIFSIEMLVSIFCWQKLRTSTKKIFINLLIGLFITAFCTSHILYSWADAHFYRPITMQRSNLPFSYPMTARNFLQQYGLFNQQKYEKQLIENDKVNASSIEYPLSKLTFDDKGSGYNLLLIVINNIKTPDFEKAMLKAGAFAQAHLQFKNHYSSGSKEETGLLGLFYGISSTYLDSILFTRKPSVLICSLEAQGYQFGLFSSDGFKNLLYRQALFTDFSLPAPMLQSNRKTTEEWYKWFSKKLNTSPWFSYIHFNTSSTAIEPYEARIKNIDQQISEIIDVLKKDHQFTKTVIIITGTYSAAENQNKIIPSKVPLIVYWPKISMQIIHKLTSHQDIMATIMQKLLHTTTAVKEYSQGENLFTPERLYPWILTKKNKKILVVTLNTMIVLDDNGSYHTYDQRGNIIQNDTSGLSLLLQVLTETKRFIAD